MLHAARPLLPDPDLPDLPDLFADGAPLPTRITLTPMPLPEAAAALQGEPDLLVTLPGTASLTHAGARNGSTGEHGLFLMARKPLDGLDVAAQLQRTAAPPAGAAG